MRILIADDHPVSRAMLAKILAASPEHTVTLTSDGAEAWSLLDDPGRSFDVLFLDLTMPRLDGFDILKRIRENAFLKSLEIVCCTASSDRATVLKAAQFGIRHYLVKPCTAALVLGKLRQLHPVG